MPWPRKNDDDAYVWVDHREEEESIVAYVSARLASKDALTTRVTDDGELFVTYRGKETKIPLTFSPHDRYVAISSLAVILKDSYRIYANPKNEADTHRLLVVRKADEKKWGKVPKHLEPLRLGVDYFGPDVKIPYSGHEEPEFAQTSSEHNTRMQGATAFHQAMFTLMFSGNVDEASLREMAKSFVNDPKLKAELGNRTEDEIVEEFKNAFGEALGDSEVQSRRAEFTTAMDEIRSLSSEEPRKTPSNRKATRKPIRKK